MDKRYFFVSFGLTEHPEYLTGDVLTVLPVEGGQWEFSLGESSMSVDVEEPDLGLLRFHGHYVLYVKREGIQDE